jgi:hypothetical protein
MISPEQAVPERWGDLTTIAPFLHGWDRDERAEWHLEQGMNPIVINGVEVGLQVYGAELSPPFNIRADQIAG